MSDHGGFGHPSGDDRRPWIWVASIVSCGYSVVTIAARLLAKWELLGVEDVLLLTAYVFGIANWALTDRAAYQGLGSGAVDVKNARDASELFLSSQVAMVCAMYLAKISVLWFARRIFSGSIQKRVRTFEVTAGVVALCGIASVILLSAGCNFRLALESSDQQCKHLSSRWIAIPVIDALTELTIIALPILYVCRSTVKLQSKLTVIVLFCLRLPNIAFSAATASSYRAIHYDHVSPTLAISSAAIWSQVLIGYALSSASIPCIRSFLTAFVAETLWRIGETNAGSYNKSSRSNGEPHSTQLSAKPTPVAMGKQDLQVDEAASVASDASQRMMIQRSVDIDVVVEGASSSDNMARRQARQSFPYQGGAAYGD